MGVEPHPLDGVGISPLDLKKAVQTVRNCERSQDSPEDRTRDCLCTEYLRRMCLRWLRLRRPGSAYDQDDQRYRCEDDGQCDYYAHSPSITQVLLSRLPSPWDGSYCPRPSAT